MRRAFNGDYPITREFGFYDPQSYGNYPGGKHPGTDYGLPANTPLVAGMSGTVTAVLRRATYTGRGNEVVITQGNKQRKSCHMNRIDVEVGQQVVEGVTQIGLSGNTGYVLPKPTPSNPNAGAHLHDELIINGQYADLESNLEEEDMITKEDIDALRIIASEVEGFDLEATHNGQFDKQLLDAWGGKPWSAYLRHAFIVNPTKRASLLQTIETLKNSESFTGKDREVLKQIHSGVTILVNK